LACETIERGQEFPTREVTGSAEDDDYARVSGALQSGTTS